MAIYINKGKRNFHPTSSDATAIPAAPTPDIGGGRADHPGAESMLVGLSNFEDGAAGGESVARYDYQNGSIASSAGLPAQASSTGAIAMADVDGDGDLDLFVGGRTVPGRYPQPASSMLFRNEGGRFVLD